MSHLASKYFTTEEPGLDPRWTAIDEYALAHLHPATRPSHGALVATLERSTAAGMPDIAVSPAMGKFLALQCRLGGVTHALEVGTLGGYSAVWLALENPELRVVTLELSPAHARVARASLEAAGVAARVEVIEGPALESLATLAAQVDAGDRPRFGCVFIDADKQNNWAYFDYGVRMAKKGAAIYIDNITRRGNLCNKNSLTDPTVAGTRLAIENVGKDDRVEATVMQTVGEKSYDGFLMAVVK